MLLQLLQQVPELQSVAYLSYHRDEWFVLCRY